MSQVLPTSLANIPWLKALDDAVIERVNDFPVQVVMTFMMGVLEETALETMATDLSVNGVGGFAQATTEAERRDVLFNAIKTRKRIGTPWAIKRAIETLGYSTPVIIEGYGTSWANFVVVLPELELTPLTNTQIQELVKYINHYKNARSKLIGVGYYDDVAPIHDGHFTYDGSITYSGLPQNTITFVT